MNRPTTVLIAAAAIALSGCSGILPVSRSSPSPSASASFPAPSDPRFAPFTEDPPVETKLSTDKEYVNRRIRRAHPVKVHMVSAPFFLDRMGPTDYWIHVVMQPRDDVLTELREEAGKKPPKLPGISPLLYPLVPQKCTWRTVDNTSAHEILDDTLLLDAVVVSDNCPLVIVKGTIG